MSDMSMGDGKYQRLACRCQGYAKLNSLEHDQKIRESEELMNTRYLEYFSLLVIGNIVIFNANNLFIGKCLPYALWETRSFRGTGLFIPVLLASHPIDPSIIWCR